MGILDEAIREHLELKRQHGAGDDELKQLEDDAFGPPGRPGDEQPDPVSEAATEFMTQPDLESGKSDADAGEGEAKAAAEAGVEPEVSEAPQGRREPRAGLVDLQEAPDAPAAPDDEPAAEEEQPAAEHEAVQEPVQSGPNTEERHAIADQPTEMFDVEAHLDADETSTEEPAPADEELVAEEISEPRLAPPAAEEEEDFEEEDDEFWSEQRLSDELHQALEAPVEDEPALAEPESAEHEPIDRTEIHEVVEHTDEHEVVEDAPAGEREAESGEHDALEETPDFLEESPDDDQLWFEQKPPKDFDFDD